jgi:hypothetical protein
MSFSIAALVAGSLATTAIIGVAVGWSTHNSQQRSKWAAQTWRDVTLRNGVTERSPFHTPTSSFNAPGMVEVFPRSHTPTPPIHPWESAQVPGERPQPTSDSYSTDNPTVHPGESPEDELPSTPLALSDPPDPAERARCRRLYQQGLSQTKLIKQVWGLSKGGGTKYSEARRRFREHVQDIATPELLAAIQAQEAKTNAQ